MTNHEEITQLHQLLLLPVATDGVIYSREIGDAWVQFTASTIGDSFVGAHGIVVFGGSGFEAGDTVGNLNLRPARHPHRIMDLEDCLRESIRKAVAEAAVES